MFLAAKHILRLSQSHLITEQSIYTKTKNTGTLALNCQESRAYIVVSVGRSGGHSCSSPVGATAGLEVDVESVGQGAMLCLDRRTRTRWRWVGTMHLRKWRWMW